MATSWRARQSLPLPNNRIHIAAIGRGHRNATGHDTYWPISTVDSSHRCDSYRRDSKRRSKRSQSTFVTPSGPEQMQYADHVIDRNAEQADIVVPQECGRSRRCSTAAIPLQLSQAQRQQVTYRGTMGRMIRDGVPTPRNTVCVALIGSVSRAMSRPVFGFRSKRG